MELRSGLRLLRDQWKLVAIVALLATAVAGVFTWRETPQYASQVTLFVSSSSSPDDAVSAYQGSLLSQQKVKSYTELLRGQTVLTGVINRLGLTLTPEQLATKVKTATIPDTSLLTATVTDPSPVHAREIASAVGDEFVKLVPTLESTPDGKQPAVRVTVVSSAEVPGRPVTPQPVRNLTLALVLGLLVGFGLAVARRSLDTTIKTVEQVEEITGAPSLGTVAYDPTCAKKPLTIDSPHGQRAEAFRKIRTNLQFADVDRPNKVVLLTSAVPHEGKSVTACNLALTMAEAERRVILVDADLRRAGTAGYLGLPDGIGLTSVLVGAASLDEATQSWGGGLFSVLASGPVPPNMSNLLGSRRMRELLDELRRRYDTVIIDAPPVLPVADAAVTASACDGVVLVVRHGKTRSEQLRNTVNGLRGVDAPIIGTVLNLAPAGGRTSYRYAYQYTYYSSRKRHPESAPTHPVPMAAHADLEDTVVRRMEPSSP